MPQIIIFKILLIVDLMSYNCVKSSSHSDKFENVYSENSGLNATNGSNTVTFCDAYNLKGHCIKIENLERIRCMNLGYFHQPHPNRNFNNIAKSINVQGNCVHVYNNTGCVGSVFEITPQSPLVCGFQLPFCWDGKVSSLSLCHATFPPKFDNPTGIRGQTCLTNCGAGQSAHFWCKVTENSWDFCFPRPEQHFWGMDCEGNCSIPAKMETTNPLLYELPKFAGKWIELELLDETTCVNLPQLNFQAIVSSIAVKGNCVKLYKSIGCTGKFLKLHQMMKAGASECHDDLAHCEFDNVAYSVSYCNASFIDLKVARTGSAGPCKTQCATNVTYFWCDSINGSRIFCVPRDGIDYLGNSCEGSACDLPEYNKDDWYPVLYDNPGYRGEYFKVGGPNEKRCYNLQFWNDPSRNFLKKTASIDLKGHCMTFYFNIGCTGYGKYIDVNDRCAFNMKTCDLKYQTSSVKYCHTELEDLYAFPQGSRGSFCHNRCITRGKNYFWCAISKDAWDFCSPRPGTDVFGDDCSDNSTCSHSDRPYMVTLYDNKNYQLNQQNINYTISRSCYDVVLKQISSINLNGNCVRLYKTKNCTGERDELVPTWMESCNSSTNVSHNDTSWLSLSFCTVDRTLSCKDAAECEDNEDRQENYVVIFDQKNYVGNHKRIDFNGGSSMCQNLKHDSITGVNFYKNVRSVQLRGIECVRIYTDVGCRGSYLILNVEKTPCSKNFDDCTLIGTEEFVASISICDIKEFGRDSNGITLIGAKCNNCSTANGKRFYNYNHCYYGQMWDYCNPKAQNHIGETCTDETDNCVFKKPKQIVTVRYDGERYNGESVTLDLGENVHCYSIENNVTKSPESIIKSIDVIQTCIVVYDALACTGRSKVISSAKTDKCKTNIASCSNGILSLTFCDAYIPPLYHIPVGSSGGLLCAEGCKTRGKTYFGCHLGDKSYDTCLPRPL